MRFMVILFLLTSSSFAKGSTTPPAQVSELASQLNQTMMVCPQKIWPNYNWSHVQIAFIYPDQEKSWLWIPATNRLGEISNKKLPVSSLQSRYSSFEINGIETLGLTMTRSSVEIYDTAIHEMFHSIGQKNWNFSAINHGRGTEYPILSTPRLYRFTMYLRLFRYINGGSKEQLQYSRYWLDLWKAEYKSDYLSATDSYEGSAQYVETMALALRESGCFADRQNLVLGLGKVLEPLGYTTMLEGMLMADLEGYFVGGLASIMLRLSNPDISVWTQRISQGELPIEVLLDGVTPIEDKIDPKGDITPSTVEDFSNSAKRTNSEYSKLIDKDIAAWKDSSYVRVQLAPTWAQTNLHPYFFVRSVALGMTVLPLAADHPFLSPDGKFHFVVAQDGVFFKPPPSKICRTETYVTLVPKAQIKFSGTVATINSDKVNGTLVGSLNTDDKGFTTLCVD